MAKVQSLQTQSAWLRETTEENENKDTSVFNVKNNTTVISLAMRQCSHKKSDRCVADGLNKQFLLRKKSLLILVIVICQTLPSHCIRPTSGYF